MLESRLTVAGVMLTLVACAPSPASDGQGSSSSANADSVQQVAVACTPSPNMPVEGRPSPYDSTAFTLGGQRSLVCYGRPSMRGRTIFGGLVPYGQLWRTGANEPTTIHLPVAATIAGIQVEPGSYSLYTVPGEQEWTVIVNASTSQWGIENQYTEEVRAQEVGRATVPSEQIDAPVETFVIRAEPQGEDAVDLVLEWETTRVRIPVQRT
ncbi:MAG TPA: DUF2911 domain-containing protein [Longimicrobiaceae bacterium]